MDDFTKLNALIPPQGGTPAGRAEAGTVAGRGKGTPKLAAHRARTVVTSQLSYQRDGAHDPVTIVGKAYRLHAEAVQAYVRELELIAGEWTEPHSGWIDVP